MVRLEELTRVPADVQDTLISLLSEKTLPIHELGTETRAQRGFNMITPEPAIACQCSACSRARADIRALPSE